MTEYIKGNDGYVKFFFEKNNQSDWNKKCNIDNEDFIKIVNSRQITENFLLNSNFTDILRGACYNEYLKENLLKILNFNPLPLKTLIPGNNEKLMLYPHQIKTINFMKEREAIDAQKIYGLQGGIIRLEMGLGKTLSAISYSLITPKKENFPTLIIASKTLLTEWKKNGFEKFFDEKDVKVLYLHEKYIGKNNLSNISRKDIINYDFVVTTYDVCSVACRSGKYHEENIFLHNTPSSDCRSREQSDDDSVMGIDIIYKTPWERVFLDESQKISNPETWTYKYILAIYGKYKWCLTGTPVKNYDSDIWAQFRFCGYNGVDKKGLWSRGYMDYIKQHNLKDAILNMDYENTHIILPEKCDNNINIEFGEMEKNVYDIIQNKTEDVFNDVICGDADFSSVLALFTRLRQCCIAPYLITEESKREKNIKEKKATSIIIQNLKEDKIKNWLLDKDGESGIYSTKMKEIIRIIKSIPSSEKILIFSSYTSVLDLLAYACKKLLEDFKFSQIDGDTKIEDRGQIIKNFENTEGLRCLFMTYKVGSEGLNLIGANHVICVEQWWTPSITKQAISRCYRSGQTKNVNVYNILIKDSIEERVNKVCISKENLSNKILGKDVPIEPTKLDKVTLGKILGIYS